MTTGTSGDDTINAGNGGETLRGLAGDDSLTGGTGTDILYGGVGADTLWGGDGGVDSLYGGKGDDVLYESSGGGTGLLDGGGGHDTLVLFYGTFFGGGIAPFDWTFEAGAVMTTPGGSTATGFEAVNVTGSDGDDTITGGRFDDLVRGWHGSDILSGGRGDDFLIGDDGNDTLYGGKGRDLVTGNGGSDLMYGGVGNDTLIGGRSFDTVGGDDTMIGGPGADQFDGVSGHAVISYADSAEGVHVDVANRIATGGDAEGDLILVDGTLVGSAFDDILGGDTDLQGGGGNDRLEAGPGTRSMTGGEGADRFVILFNAHVIYESPTITDFDQGLGELIDLSLIDPRRADGDQAFRFIGTAAFDGKPGEVRYEIADGHTIIQMQVNQHGTAALHQVTLDGEHTLTEADFVL